MNDGEDETHIHGDVGAFIKTNKGKVRVNQHYHGDLERYRAMAIDELRTELTRLKKKRRATLRAFLCHRTVPWSIGAMIVLTIFFLMYWGEKPTVATALTLLICISAVFLTVKLMVSRRRPLFDGLAMLKTDLKFVEAFIAIHEAEAAYER